MENNNSNWYDNNYIRLVRNLALNPIRGGIDADLFVADKLGVPTNVTNYLRDINNASAIKFYAGLSALIRTAKRALMNREKVTFQKFVNNYDYYRQNPSFS